MYSLRSIMAVPKFLSQGLIIKSLFFLSSSNIFSWFLFKFPVGIGVLDLYRVQSSLENFSRGSYNYRDFSRGGRM